MGKGMLDRANEFDIEWMVEAYAEYVYRLAYEFTCDPVDAEDVTYAAFLSARELCGHISECDCVADILYAITSAVAHEKLESDLGATKPDAGPALSPVATGIASPDGGHAGPCTLHAGDTRRGEETFLDVSLPRFSPGLDVVRATLSASYGYGGYSI